MDEEEDTELLQTILHPGSKISFTGQLIVELNQMMKKPSIESSIAPILRRYKSYIDNTDILVENGIFSINFAEAGLLLQVAVAIWAKRVDLLWDFGAKMQERQLEYDTKPREEEEVKKIEERKSRFKRKKKAKPVEDVEVKKQTLENRLDKFTEINLTPLKSEEEAFVDYDKIDMDNDLEFREWWDPHRVPNPHDDFPDVNDNIKNDSDFIYSKKHTNLFQNFYPGVSISDNFRKMDEDEECERVFPYESFSTWKNTVHLMTAYNKSFITKTQPESAYIRANLCEEALNQFLHEKGISYNDMDEYRHEFSTFLEEYKRKYLPENELSCAPVNQKSLVVRLARLPQDVVDKCMKNENLRKTIDSISDLDSGFCEFFEGDCDQPVTSTPNSRNETRIEEFVEDCRRGPKRKLELTFELKTKTRRTTSKLKINSFLVTSLRDFDLFVQNNYHPEEGEGEIIPIEDVCEELDSGNCDEGISESHAASIRQETTTYHADDLRVEAVEARYNEWKTFIAHKLDGQSAQDIDIHEEETKVIASMGNVGNTVSYKKLRAGKTTKSAACIFAAMLHLANSGNIEIINPNKCRLGNDTLKLKLLSTERQHEHLNEYVAPSEATFQNRLQNVQKTIQLKRLNNNQLPDSFKKRSK